MSLALGQQHGKKHLKGGAAMIYRTIPRYKGKSTTSVFHLEPNWPTLLGPSCCESHFPSGRLSGEMLFGCFDTVLVLRKFEVLCCFLDVFDVSVGLLGLLAASG